MTLIRMLDIHEEIPLVLLLLADPNEEKIYEYIRKGVCFVLEINTAEKTRIIGASVIVELENGTFEITNIAIDAPFQGKGYGRLLINHILNYIKQKEAKNLIIATANSSLMQLGFYQRCGFRMDHIEKDYFLEHYPEPMYENGIQSCDRIVLSMQL